MEIHENHGVAGFGDLSVGCGKRVACNRSKACRTGHAQECPSVVGMADPEHGGGCPVKRGCGRLHEFTMGCGQGKQVAVDIPLLRGMVASHFQSVANPEKMSSGFRWPCE